jgi:hypothetical protein
MITWSINWDAASTCTGVYPYANKYESIFGVTANISTSVISTPISVYPNTTSVQFTVSTTDNAEILVTEVLEQMILEKHVIQNTTNLQLENIRIKKK